MKDKRERVPDEESEIEKPGNGGRLSVGNSVSGSISVGLYMREAEFNIQRRWLLTSFGARH